MGCYMLASALAKRPYVVEELGLPLYCAEEMCYYIFHNISMINENLLEERFFQFVGEECQLPDLSDQLRAMKQSGKSTAEVLTIFLRAIHYYEEDEIRQFQKKMDGYRNVHPLVRRKDKGDILLMRRRYQNAIREYEYILSQPRAGGLGEEFYRQTSDSLCAALIRMGFWKEAYNCCLLSWRRWKKIDTAEKICLLSVQNGWEIPEEIDKRIRQEATRTLERKKEELLQDGHPLCFETGKKEFEGEEALLESIQEYLLAKKEEYRMEAADFS